MKKWCFLLVILLITNLTVQATETPSVTKNVQKQQIQKTKAQREAEFEQKLGLTEEQKILIREARQKSFEKIRPIMEEIKTKKEEISKIKKARLDVGTAEKKISALEQDLLVLEKQANTIRQENMKNFESLLTNQQKEILKQMKKDGRQKYGKSHPKRYAKHNFNRKNIHK